MEEEIAEMLEERRQLAEEQNEYQKQEWGTNPTVENNQDNEEESETPSEHEIVFYNESESDNSDDTSADDCAEMQSRYPA